MEEIEQCMGCDRISSRTKEYACSYYVDDKLVSRTSYLCPICGNDQYTIEEWDEIINQYNNSETCFVAVGFKPSFKGFFKRVCIHGSILLFLISLAFIACIVEMVPLSFLIMLNVIFYFFIVFIKICYYLADGELGVGKPILEARKKMSRPVHGSIRKSSSSIIWGIGIGF